LDHHDSFDSTTSQSKNFTRAEVTRWRDQLHDHFANISSGSQTKATADDLSEHTSPPRAWRNPWVTKSDGPQLFPYRSSNGFDGVCVIERIPVSDGRIVIACVATPGNPGNSITNTVETIFEQVCLHFEIDPAKVVWLENYEYINPTEWLHVVFSQVPPDGWGEPKWRTMSQVKWDELGLRPVARMKTNHGELISKLRKFSPASQTSD
jgi:hypothetical protein